MGNEPLITNERGAREWAWLCERVGEERARAAIAKIPGTKRAYPLNIARVLGITLPPPDRLPLIASDARRNAARAALADARAALGRRAS